ncbi:MAG: PAS domain S-box protein [Bacteroidota bacterium]|nr:PAS domain S-box protein [Bacteroidota bacterium]
MAETQQLNKGVITTKEEERNLSRLYAFIRQVNQMILRTHNEHDLYNKSCEIAVGSGGFHMAWVGLIDQETNHVTPVAKAGNEQDYLSKTSKISVKENPQGLGPTGNSIRNGDYYVCNDILNDPLMLPWKNDAIKRGYRSSMSLALKRFGNVIGAICLYSSIPYFFDNDETNLLCEFASDISFALERIEIEKRREIAEKLLQESERKLSTLIGNLPGLAYRCRNDKQWTMEYVSEGCLALCGYTPEDLIGNNKLSFSDLIVPEYYDYIWEKWQKVLRIRSSFKDEYIIKTANGDRKWVLEQGCGIYDENGKVIAIEGFILDITERKNSEEELKRSREEYKMIFEEDLTGDFVSSVDGRMLNCNPAFLKIFGFSSKEEALGYNFEQTYVNINDRIEKIREIKDKRKLENYHMLRLRKDGKLLHVIENVIGKFSDTGELIGLNGYLIDDTERYLTEDKLRKLSRAVEQCPVAIMITTKEGQIEYVNPVFEESSGYKLSEIRNLSYPILRTEITSDKVYQDLLNSLSSGKDWNGEFLYKRKDNTSYWVSVSISSIRDTSGEVTHYLVIEKDVTENKLNELQLVKSKEKAEESDKLKSAFLANMSHEIRTPLNSIMGFSELLNDDRIGKKESAQYIDLIQKSGNQLLSIINDILDISKIEAGLFSVHLENINLNELIIQIYNQFRIPASGKELQLNVIKPLEDKESILETDSVKLKQILTNLINNAIKFTHSGGIAFGYHVLDGYLEFFVKDSGIGITKKNQRLIFERFRQVDITSNRSYGGNGLGLSICKGLVNLLGGEIRVESEIGEGSVFYFTIPYAN